MIIKAHGLQLELNLTEHYITPLKKCTEIAIGLLLKSIRIVLTFDIKIDLFKVQIKKCSIWGNNYINLSNNI